MTKRRKPINPRAASILRKAISDGRSDAERWGHPTADGEDAPCWKASLYWRGVGGEPQWIQDLYEKTYARIHRRALRQLWSSRSAAEVREAKRNAARNRELRWETQDERERRLLREKVARLQQEVESSGRTIDLSAHRQPEAAL